MPLERRVEFQAGYDCIRFECRHGSERCRPDSGGSHGKHGLTLRWLVIGEAGAVQFTLYTGWLPEPERTMGRSRDQWGPLPADLGYHARKPQYEGQSQMGSCDVLADMPGGCYYDGSSLNADEPFRVLCSFGGDALWAFLERYYAATFAEGAWPKGEPYGLAERGERGEEASRGR